MDKYTFYIYSLIYEWFTQQILWSKYNPYLISILQLGKLKQSKIRQPVWGWERNILNSGTLALESNAVNHLIFVCVCVLISLHFSCPMFHPSLALFKSFYCLYKGLHLTPCWQLWVRVQKFECLYQFATVFPVHCNFTSLGPYS